MKSKNPTEDSPLATVRYTEYSDKFRRKVQKVNQVEVLRSSVFSQSGFTSCQFWP